MFIKIGTALYGHRLFYLSATNYKSPNRGASISLPTILKGLFTWDNDLIMTVQSLRMGGLFKVALKSLLLFKHSV